MCIYYSSRHDLHYGSGEHIIPAGLGGKLKLPNHYVSQEFNNDISKYERWFMEDSIFTSIRQIVGPGSRGRSAEKFESTSKVHILEDHPDGQSLSLGFIQKGKPKLIPYIQFDNESKEFLFGLNNQPGLDLQQEMEKFAVACESVQTLCIKSMTDQRLPISTIMFGYQPGLEGRFDGYFFCHPDNPIQVTQLNFAAIATAVRNSGHTPQTSTNQVKSQQNVLWKDEYYRIIGKLCFNFLAHAQGKDVALHSCFDPVRQWIAHGGENHFASFIPADRNLLTGGGIAMPDDGHCILLMVAGRHLYGLCSLYKAFPIRVLLTDSLPLAMPAVDGFICDWRHQQEYRLNEYLAKTLNANPDGQ